MRRVGELLLIMGLLLGLGVGVGMIVGLPLAGAPWLIRVGMIKLALLGAVGLMSGGAFLQRVARRAEERERLR